MARPAARKIIALIGIFLAVWLGIRYLLPVVLPFLLGGGLAILAEPLVGVLSQKLRLKRPIAVFLGVGALLAAVLGLLALLGAAAWWELGNLAGQLPGLLDSLRSGWEALNQWLSGLADKAPAALSGALSAWVQRFSTAGSGLLDQISGRVLGMAGTLLGILPRGLLFLGTAILSAFLISAKLPMLRSLFSRRKVSPGQQKVLDTLHTLRQAISGWLRAELRLAGITFLIVTAGLLLLRIPYCALWSGLIALVDAVPMLGTGTILMPWAGLCLLRHQSARAIGLLGIYLAAMLTRSTLEPRLVGRQLGLDPLLTLGAFYVGYRLWGVGGMLLSPILTVTAVQLCELRQNQR